MAGADWVLAPENPGGWHAGKACRLVDKSRGNKKISGAVVWALAADSLKAVPRRLVGQQVLDDDLPADEAVAECAYFQCKHVERVPVRLAAMRVWTNARHC